MQVLGLEVKDALRPRDRPATGLLDGNGATTHWRYTAELAQRFPAIAVDPDVLYVDSGQLITSAGSAAGIDLLIEIVRRDFGAEAANSVARRLVVPAQPALTARAGPRCG